MKETEEMRELRHQQGELNKKYKELQAAQIVEFQRGEAALKLVGKCYRTSTGGIYYKITNVPQINYMIRGGFPEFNEYQFPCIKVDFSEGFISDDETIFVGEDMVPQACRGKPYVEVEENEFEGAIRLFFRERGIEL
jgi:hypothetical protein